jgi:type I restriction enzyme S subunit
MASLARVGDLAEQIRGVTYGKEDASKAPMPGYLPVLRAGNITDSGLAFDDLVYVPEARVAAKQRIKKGDIVIAASSGSLDVVGKAAAALDAFNGGFGAFCKVIRPNSKVDAGYLAQFFKTPSYRRTISSLAAGANINNLKSEHLDDLQVPLPALPEQRRIAAILDQADALRAKRRESLEQLDGLTQSIFIEMFGDPATNPMNWEVVTLESIATKVTDGEHLTPRRTSSGIKLLSARNVRDGYLDFGDVDYVDEAEYQRISKRCNPELDDILISCSGSIGRVAIVEIAEPLALVRSAALVKPDRRMIGSKFLETYLRSAHLNRLMIKSAHSSSQANLFQGPIRSLPVFLPRPDLQHLFEDRYRAVRKIRAGQAEATRELDALFASLQQRAFAGQLS